MSFISLLKPLLIFQNKILKCYKTNLYGTLNLFNFCKKNKPKNLIFSSSMAVYGKNSIKPNEQKKCLPISHYGFSKLLGEKI